MTAMAIPPVPSLLACSLSKERPPQRAFDWNRGSWEHYFSGVAGVPEHLATLPDGVDRQRIAKVVRARLNEGRQVEAFVTAMIWGHGTNGYGPWRTGRVITGSSSPAGQPVDAPVVEKLAESATIASSEGAGAAYRYLNNEGHIKHLGPAFFTKWIYFVTAAGDAYGAQGAPILDKVVMEWMNAHTDLALHPYYTADYTTYLETLDVWASAQGVTPVKVEETIFLLARSGS